jgi:pimeloyl-ACP methyl ester carboxylesterase
MIVIQLPESGREPDMDQDHRPAKPDPAQLALQMLTPRRQRRRGGLYIEDARRIAFACDGERVSALQVGAGPLVLLVHGWEGAAADFSTLLPALLGEGYAVALLDLPAHGDSGGTRATLPAAARAVAEFGRRHGPLHGVIGHSLGAAAVGEALKLGLAAGAAVLLAPPRRYLDGVEAAVAACGYDAGEREALLAELLRLGVDAAALDLRQTVAGLRTPAQIVHSDDDAVLPQAAGRSIAAAWRGSRFLGVAGLGHSRLLHDAAVVGEVSTFLAGLAADAASRTAAAA